MVDDPETADVRVQAAAARTSAAGSARLSFGLGAPTLDEQDRLGDGVVDFTARLAHVSRILMSGRMRETMQNLPTPLTRPREMIYEGAATLMRTGDSWGVFGDDDEDGPNSGENPLWPLDALFGAEDDVIEVGTDTVRDVSTTHYRLPVDLVAADEFLAAGIAVPGGPLRRLRRLPAEVWLDAAGLARRIAIQNAAGDRQVWQVSEFWDFGVPTTTTSPDPSEITKLDSADMARIFMEDAELGES